MERGFRASRLPAWAQPVAGGLIVAGFAIYTPQALGAGHGALDLDITLPMTGAWLAALIVIKLVACLVSLASGFRGGLFFASLFIGALLGKLYALAILWALPGVTLDATACVFAGMATLGVAIVGGPLTMAFLVLESSGDLPVAGGVLAACIATSLTVRMTFGYSFSTWRLHLRGETIRGAFDVGWQRDLTVARLMDRDPTVGHAEETLAEFRASHTLVGAAHLVLEDAAGGYAGLVEAPEAFATEHSGELPLSALARLVDVSLSPEMGVKEALALFEASGSELLAVVDPESGALLGTLGEAVAARRYAEALSNVARGVLDPN
jgi:CIC family chloride channel protein